MTTRQSKNGKKFQEYDVIPYPKSFLRKNTNLFYSIEVYFCMSLVDNINSFHRCIEILIVRNDNKSNMIIFRGKNLFFSCKSTDHISSIEALIIRFIICNNLLDDTIFVVII